MPFFKRLSLVGIINSFFCFVALIVVILCNLHLLNHLDSCSHTIPQQIIQTNNNQMLIGDVSIDNKAAKQKRRSRIYQYYNNANFNMYLSSLSSEPEFNPDTQKKGIDCIVFLSDPIIINSTLGAIYNMREPTLGNWSECIIVIGNNIDKGNEQFNYVYRYFKCLNVYHLDITNDALKNDFPHVHYWKTYMMIHPFFRENEQLFRYILYLDSDCITLKPIRSLIDRTVRYIMDKYEADDMNNIWLAWREDYRHKSMYKAVLDLNKYDVDTLTELKKEYPDYVESKQGNVMLLNMMQLPDVKWFKSEIKRIMDKYSVGFWRNDQSLFNLMFYYNSSDLGWSAFTHPPSEQLFYPPDGFPMVHTGGHEAMALRRPKEERGGIKREPEKAWYHSLWEFWMYKLLMECPKLDHYPTS